MEFLNSLANQLIFSMASGWSIENFLTNLNKNLTAWGKLFVVVVGLVMVIVAIVKIAKGLMSGGRAQTNWVLNIVLFFVGGALAFGSGWGLVTDISKGGSDTLNDLGKVVIPLVTGLF
jgi:hypothetical protein